MMSIPTARLALSRLGAALVTAGLVGWAGGANASAVASVAITGFTVGTNADPSAFVFGATDYQNQSWDLRAQNGGFGLVQQNSSVASWANVDQTAQTSLAGATVSSSVFTDNATQLNTPGFTLAAHASPSINPPSNPNRGSGSFVSSGVFCFGDGAGFDGTSAGCNAAGELTLTVFYDLLASVDDPAGQLAEASMALHVSNGDGSISDTLSDFTSAATGGSRLGLWKTYTLDLAAGDVAFFDLSGAVLVTAIPEPSTLALIAIAGLGIGFTRRRGAAVSLPA